MENTKKTSKITKRRKTLGITNCELESLIPEHPRRLGSLFPINLSTNSSSKISMYHSPPPAPWALGASTSSRNIPATVIIWIKLIVAFWFLLLRRHVSLNHVSYLHGHAILSCSSRGNKSYLKCAHHIRFRFSALNRLGVLSPLFFLCYNCCLLMPSLRC